MESFFSRYKNAFFLLLLLLAQTLGLAVQVQHPGQSGSAQTPQIAQIVPVGVAAGNTDLKGVSLLRSWTAGLVTPFERVSHSGTLAVRHLWSNYLDLRHTHQQNADLQQQIARLRLEQAAFAEDAAQGRRLQSLLAFKQQYVSTTVAAQVIGTSGSDRSRVVTLDKGADYGLKPDMPVITPDGAVGKLREVFAHTSQLLLLNDLSSGAGVTLVSTRIRGIVQGAAGGRITINDLTADSRIQPGEKVVTSGGDLVYPRGLPVGVIESIVPDPQHQPYMAMTVKPFANLARLEEVLVVTGLSNELTVEAKEDAAQASSTAAEEAAQRAADVLAAKLPGLDKPSFPGATGASGATGGSGATGASGAAAADPNAADRGGLPGIPNSGLPRVQPPAHTDRYSSGAAPPAAELKPGGGPNGKPETPEKKPDEPQ